MNKRVQEAVVVLSLVALTAVFAWRRVNFGAYPLEDAAIIMRYAQHMAAGHGIVWNIAEHPVDGATDFLFLVVVAFVHWIGFSVESAVRLITIGSHFGTVALIYLGMRRVQRAGVMAAWVSAAYFAVGPGLFLVAAYFGTPFFALGVAIAWLLGQRLINQEGGTLAARLVFSLACLVVGLIRPEGVLIAVFMAIALGLTMPLKAVGRLAVVFGSVFLILGGTYFIWRWNYFGYPLPNPFYKKGGGHLYVSSLKVSIRNSAALLFPIIPAFLLSLRSTRSLRMGVAFLVPIAGTVCMWLFLSNEMNFGTRFQYPVLVLGVLSWYPLVKTLREDLGLPRFASLAGRQQLAVTVAAAAVLGIVFQRHMPNSAPYTYSKDGRWDVAMMLRKYADRHYTMATTEAGLLPLYSQWRDIDTWGLNDQWIAHHGLITEEYLRQQKPDVIMWFCFFTPQHPVPKVPPWWREWYRHVLTLQKYALDNHFTLAAVYGVSPDETHYYYVRSDLPDHDAIVQGIRSIDYAWFKTGEKCVNYADQPPAVPVDVDGHER